MFKSRLAIRTVLSIARLVVFFFLFISSSLFLFFSSSRLSCFTAVHICVCAIGLVCASIAHAFFISDCSRVIYRARVWTVFACVLSACIAYTWTLWCVLVCKREWTMPLAYRSTMASTLQYAFYAEFSCTYRIRACAIHIRMGFHHQPPSLSLLPLQSSKKNTTKFSYYFSSFF